MLRRAAGIADLTLTTNGSLLARKAQALATPACERVTVSLDSLDDATFRAHERRGLSGRARARGHRGGGGGRPRPDQDQHGREARRRTSSASCPWRGISAARGHILRFIEYMDVGHTNGWRMDDVVPAAEIVDDASTPSCRSSRSAPNYRGEVAQRWRYRDGGGEIGVIASVTQAFCGDCTRARLSADGQALHLPVRDARPRPAGARCAAARADEEIAARERRRLGRRATTATRRSGRPRPRSCREGGDVATSAAESGPGSAPAVPNLQPQQLTTKQVP